MKRRATDPFWRLEARFICTKDILAWCHGAYTEEQLNRLTMPELSEIHNNAYYQHIAEIETIRK